MPVTRASSSSSAGGGDVDQTSPAQAASGPSVQGNPPSGDEARAPVSVSVEGGLLSRSGDTVSALPRAVSVAQAAPSTDLAAVLAALASSNQAVAVSLAANQAETSRLVTALLERLSAPAPPAQQPLAQPSSAEEAVLAALQGGTNDARLWAALEPLYQASLRTVPRSAALSRLVVQEGLHNAPREALPFLELADSLRRVTVVLGAQSAALDSGLASDAGERADALAALATLPFKLVKVVAEQFPSLASNARLGAWLREPDQVELARGRSSQGLQFFRGQGPRSPAGTRFPAGRGFSQGFGWRGPPESFGADQQQRGGPVQQQASQPRGRQRSPSPRSRASPSPSGRAGSAGGPAST